MSDISILDLLREATLDAETGERLFDDVRPDLYVSDIRNVIAEIERLQAALRQVGHWIHVHNDDAPILRVIDAALSGKGET